MGKFDGVLLCSDIDGTLRAGERTPEAFEKNREAVRYFKEQGGTFTIVTGRTKSFLLEPELFEMLNAPAGLLNGAMVYDFKQERPIHICWLPYTVGELTELTRGFDGRVETATVFYEVASEAVHSSLPLDKRICDIHPFKLVFRFTDPETTLEFRDIARRDARFGGCYFARSWPYGVECTNAASTKADMMEIVKRATGCRYTVAIGDYDNDVPMIKAADLGVAVKSGAECALQVADRVVCACEDGAVAELIYSL